jgi:hypothetical protein
VYGWNAPSGDKAQAALQQFQKLKLEWPKLVTAPAERLLLGRII